MNGGWSLSRTGICQFSRGGVLGKNNLAIIYGIGHCSSSEDILEIIAHEIGHSLSLNDTDKDGQLGRPERGETKDNYMDYNIQNRQRFYRTQWENVLLFSSSIPQIQ